MTRIAYSIAMLSIVACTSSSNAPAAPPAPAAAPVAAPTSQAPGDPSTPNGVERFRDEIKTAGPRQWLVLEPAALEARDRGAWDDYRVGSPVVMKDGSQSRYRMWYVGCRLARKEHNCGIGHATSADGIAWTRSDSPIFVPPDLPPTYWVNAITVAKSSERYLMWYSVDGDPVGDRPRATLRMATSTDGLAWQDAGLVHTTAKDGSRTMRHATYHDGQTVHLWYFDEPGDDDTEALVHFTSPDGRTWTMAGSDTLNDGASRVGRPWMTSDGRGGFRALLVDRRDGGAAPALRWLASTDGTTWTTGEGELQARVSGDTTIYDLSAIEERDGLWIWMTTAQSIRSAESIGVAFRKGSGS